MKYLKWCKQYATQIERIRDDTNIEQERQIIRDETERLNKRLTKILKCYGHKSFTKVGNGVLSYETIQELSAIRNNKLKKLSDKYWELDKEIVQLSGRNDLYAEKQIEQKRKKKVDIYKQLKKLVSVDDSIQNMINLTGQERFEEITEDEQKIFEMLLDETKFKLLKNETVSTQAMKCREEFMDLLYKVRHRESWELTMTDVDSLKQFLLFPGVEELMIIYEYLYEELHTEEDVIDDSYFKEINSIYRKICRLQEKILNDHASKIDWKGITGFDLKELQEGEENIIV